MTSPFRKLNGPQAHRTVSGIADSLTGRLSTLSITRSHGSTALRGYARMARTRFITPKSPSGPSSTPTSSSTTALSSKAPSTIGRKTGDASNIKLPGDFKLSKVQKVPEYDPNMVIFLDKHGNVSMIPQDDRVKGQTKEEFDAFEDVDVDVPGYIRGSKEAEYGRKRIGQVELPQNILESIRGIIDEEDKALIRTDALRLYGSLRSTRALEGDEFIELPTKRMKSGSKDMANGDRPVPAHILEYGHRESIAYVAAMAPTAYSAIKNVLEEVNRRVPTLQPKTFLDFGTGPGTAIWAANEVWDTPMKYTGVDASMAMLETAEEILNAMSSRGTPIQDVAFKPFMSHGPQAAKHDIVMSAFVLSELTTPALRKSTLEHLWDSTNDILVLIDRGTPNGFKVLSEAREQILGLDTDRIKTNPKYDAYGIQLPEEEPTKREPAYVLAPCPHDGVCPMYASLARGSQWCHFSQKVQRPDFLRKTKHSKANFEDAKYTYVVLRKGPRPTFTPTSPTPIPAEVIETTESPAEPNTSTQALEHDSSQSPPAVPRKKKYTKLPPPPPVTYDTPEDMFAASNAWSRIVVPPLKKDGHVVIDTCGASGYLERIIIPKSQGKVPYRDARKAMWGDLFPHQPKNKAVRKEIPGQNNVEAEGEKKKKDQRSSEMSAEAMLRRTKQKVKKQSRQKISVDKELSVDGSKKTRKGKKDEEGDFFLEL
ncbi:37S ribosomal protein S22 [Haplosporangium sp. Z 767]|nr:37S ribosomal protein S22 [Haplosporangium sp. Z 11]KAF9177877.1 37S ribosomal protein S22 [Haplosporangium sp. Z 767]